MTLAALTALSVFALTAISSVATIYATIRGSWERIAAVFAVAFGISRGERR